MALPSPCWQGAQPKGARRGEDWSSPRAPLRTPRPRRVPLLPQSAEARIIADMGGRVYGPYTGRYYASRRETDIGHMVAASEAHDSGLCAADAATKRRFAGDLPNLTLASTRVNRHAMSEKDAGEWMPGMNRCWFAARVVAVKRKYGLNVDAREAASWKASCRVAPRPGWSWRKDKLRWPSRHRAAGRQAQAAR